MNRRRFFKTTAGASLAIATPAIASFAQPELPYGERVRQWAHETLVHPRARTSSLILTDYQVEFLNYSRCEVLGRAPRCKGHTTAMHASLWYDLCESPTCESAMYVSPSPFDDSILKMLPNYKANGYITEIAPMYAYAKLFRLFRSELLVEVATSAMPRGSSMRLLTALYNVRDIQTLRGYSSDTLYVDHFRYSSGLMDMITPIACRPNTRARVLVY